MVPGERALGLVMNQSVRDNILLPSLERAVAAASGSTAAPATAWSPSSMELLDIRPRRPELRGRARSRAATSRR